MRFQPAPPIPVGPNPPAHVPQHLIFDFDLFGDQRIGEDVQGSLANLLADAPDIFWTTHHGGHWVAKSFDAISKIVTDPDVFSAREMQIPRVQNPPFMIPLNLDPPENLPYRRAMMPMFGPSAIKILEPRIREWAVGLVDGVAEKGACDFQADVAKVFPVSVFMELMGMDLSRLQEFRRMTEDYFDSQNDEAEMMRLAELIQGTLTALLEEKRRNPDDKLMSYFLAADIGGRTMRDDEILAMSFVLFVGGMDTVTNLTGFAYRQLAQMPDVQARLAADPALAAGFTDEAIRLYGVINTPRLVMQQACIGDAHFMPGEMLVNILSVGSRDPAKFDRSNMFDIDRKRTASLTFSSGPHLCVGHVLARAEIRILTEEWMKRIPSFRLAPGKPHGFRLGTVMGIENLPLEWSAPDHANEPEMQK